MNIRFENFISLSAVVYRKVIVDRTALIQRFLTLCYKLTNKCNA
jgi:hypothetical protein